MYTLLGRRPSMATTTIKKKKKCVKGFECGYSCIKQGLKCSEAKQAEAKGYLESLTENIEELTPLSAEGAHREYIGGAKKFVGEGDFDDTHMRSIIEALVKHHGVNQQTINKKIKGIRISKANSDKTLEAAKYFIQISGGEILSQVKTIKSVGKRASCMVDWGFVDVGSNPNIILRTTLHELSHFFESNQAIAKASRDFIASRATSNKPEKLRDITGDNKYRDDEIAYPDNFISPYVGKVYPSGRTEVPSIGIQHFATREKMVNLYKADPEHFLFSLGILLGIDSLRRSGGNP